MAFSRIQGNKITILHSSRIDGQVKQIKLHTFNKFSDAQELVDSDFNWNLLCETLKKQFSVQINKKKLRQNIESKLKTVEFQETDSTNKAILQVLWFLKNCKLPLSPEQRKILNQAKENLLQIKDIVDNKLLFLDYPMDFLEKREETDAEKCLEQGLELYSQGAWDEARSLFLKGLEDEPDHVDLLVHAGLTEFILSNFSLALNYFNDAEKFGKQFADLMIETDPETYIKNIDLDKWTKNRLCDLAGECPDRFTDRCNNCEESPKYKKTELYRYLEFRPFFRSLTNKALTLMKLKKFKDAINTLKLCQEYQVLLGTSNMMGICYLSIGDYEKADEWLHEFLWDDSYYIKALIKYLLGQTSDAFKYLLPGIIKNPFIANMLIGKEMPEEVRYIGDVLPNRLKASEFIHEQGYLFKKNPDFRNLIHCVLEDDEILNLLEELEIQNKKRKNDKNFKMDKNSWNLLHGTISDDFIDQFVPKFTDRFFDKNGSYWKPKNKKVLNIRIINKKKQNWLVKLENYDNEFYFRPRFYVEDARDGDLIQIFVSKSWFYKKRLFVSGEIK